jgi:hypothetical protein
MSSKISNFLAVFNEMKRENLFIKIVVTDYFLFFKFVTISQNYSDDIVLSF